MPETNENIILKGVNTHNLKNITVEFKYNKFNVVTGRSGSGKSSLVFSSLYAESFRRYVSSLSTSARQFIKSLPKPDINDANNLPPAVALKQKTTNAHFRSTVASLTETDDLLAMLFSFEAECYCNKCNIKVQNHSVKSILADLFKNHNGLRVDVYSPLERFTKIKKGDLVTQLLSQGFNRVLVKKELVKLESLKQLNIATDLVLIDRITISEKENSRITAALKLAKQLGTSFIICAIGEQKYKYFSERTCVMCKTKYPEPSIALFSSAHPIGACASCNGFGKESVLDKNKVIDDMDKSLLEFGVVPWNFGRYRALYSKAIASANKRGLDVEKPFKDYSFAELKWLYEGEEKGRGFKGINGFFAYLDKKKYKQHYRIHASRFKQYIKCRTCAGAKLNSNSLSYKLNSKTIAELFMLNIFDLKQFVSNIVSKNSNIKQDDFLQLYDELTASLNYLALVGVGYLHLYRESKSLSGGELQRVKLTRALTNQLNSTMFCLDEPTTGLHSQDVEKITKMLLELRDKGNTVVIVEHDTAVIQKADNLICIGPQAGHMGGEVVYAGVVKDLKIADSANYPARNEQNSSKPFVSIENANCNNLKNISVKFPLNSITGFCGVSGSGKTSLVAQTIYPLMKQYFEGGNANAKLHGATINLDHENELKDVLYVSQESLSRSKRSTIATYLGIMTTIRNQLAKQEQAKKLKLTASHFSFNSKGGRCEECKGLGVIVEDLSFLGEVEVVCHVCDGKRFNDEVLRVDIDGYNLTQILAMTITQAKSFFKNCADIVKSALVLEKLGLGYLSLGQNTSSFSGGEAQRLRLVSLIKNVANESKQVLIFDEPTTGLSDYDVDQINKVFLELKSLGHTILVIEHHTKVLENCDWLVELGVGAAQNGGEVVFCGKSKDIKSVAQSPTAKYLF